MSHLNRDVAQVLLLPGRVKETVYFSHLAPLFHLPDVVLIAKFFCDLLERIDPSGF